MQKLAEICVRRPVFATMLILSLTVVGVFSFSTLGVDLFPKIDLPTITVSVVNPGAGPREIETEITDKVEAAVNTISGIDELRSTSVEGVSQVFVQFLLDKDVDVAAQEIRDKVSLIRGDLPETAEDPVIIWLDPDKMRAYNVTVPEVVAALRSQNLEVPGGRVDEGARELTVRTMGRITNPADFNHVSIGTRGSYAVKVSDIGYVEDGTEEQRTSARLNGQPAVTLIVSEQSGQNSVEVADALKERLAELGPALAKKGV